MHYHSTNPIHYTKEQAERANEAFDRTVKQFLRNWMQNRTLLGESVLVEDDAETFIEHGALRSYFIHTPNALERLLRQSDIARHLLRPLSQVYFKNDAYEPLFARFEQRIYNLAAYCQNLEVPFRYNSPSRQGVYGDTLSPAEPLTEPVREDIGMYFGTRRSDTTALTILARQLRQEVLPLTHLPIHIVTEGYMEDSLRAVKSAAQLCHERGNDQLQCFLIQRRHAADDRHLSAALLIMNPRQPHKPQRVIFCDTLNPFGQPPWWDKFKHKLDTVFPQPTGAAPASDLLEDGGVKLQRLHDGVPVRHQDIDCAFYTYSIVRALIQLVQADPDLILMGTIDAIVSQMTALMPEYYAQANQPKEPALVRLENVVRRWNTGREAMRNQMSSNYVTELITQPAHRAEFA